MRTPNKRTPPPQPISFIAATMVVGGLLAIAMPAYTITIAGLAILTMTAGAGIWTLSANLRAPGMTGWSTSRFNQLTPSRKNQPSGKLDRISVRLSGRRHHIQNASPMPPDAVRLLQPLIRSALEREGFSLTDPTGQESAQGALSLKTWAILTSDPAREVSWFTTIRPNTRQVAEVVNDVLDELEQLSLGGSLQAIPSLAPFPSATPKP